MPTSKNCRGHSAASTDRPVPLGMASGDEAGNADEARPGEMTRQEATALLDAERNQEVQPGEIVRRLQGAVVAEPAEDW